MKQRFREDTAGTLVHYPGERGVSSAATVTLYYPGASELQAAANATIDSVSTTVAAAASRGAHSFTVADATGITAGVRYLVEESGRKMPVEVKSVASTTVYIVDTLRFALTTSSTVKGYRLSYALTDTHTAERDDNYRALWQYTIDTVAHKAESTYDVVSAIEWYPTTIEDVTARHPRVRYLLSTNDLDGYELLRTAWQQKLIPQLLAKGLRIERVRDYESLKPLHVAYCNEIVAEHSAMIDSGNIGQHDIASANAEQILTLITTDLSWYDADDDLIAASGEEHLNLRGFRITR